jgi:hypothetical protein
MRKLTSDSRTQKKRREVNRRRFGGSDVDDDDDVSLDDVLLKLKAAKYGDRKSLEWLKNSLAKETVTAEQVRMRLSTYPRCLNINNALEVCRGRFLISLLGVNFDP